MRARLESSLQLAIGRESGYWRVTGSGLLRQPFLELRRERERLDRGELVGIGAAQVVEDRFVLPGEERELPARWGRRAVRVGEPRPALAIELGALEVAQDLLGADDDARGQAGEACDL